MKQATLPNLLTSHQRLQVAARACVSTKSVDKAYRGQPIRSTVAARITEAARALQLPEPAIVIAR